ncbi:GTP cyclohydrolase I, partial [Stenotrophomonas sp. 3diitr2024]|uniref:HPF/RaiA family ribosome-associated protein n=1 Tax=Stenotrophomonas sp. 3diitr2024 TaxID=3345115 RepID=UPI0035C96188
MAPIIGRVHVGYLPAGKVVGISKLARIGKHFDQHCEARVTLKLQKTEHHVDASLNIPGQTLHAGHSVSLGLLAASLVVVPVGVVHAGTALLDPEILAAGLLV